MMQSGVKRIDDLLAGTGAAIAAGEADAAAVGLVQDLLRGQGYRRMPSVLDASRGTFGKGTTKAVVAFRKATNLPDGDDVDQATLVKLVQRPATEPIASPGYITLVLGINFTGLIKLVSLVSAVEGGGKFASLCKNTDTAGLSVGIIQWAQKPGALHELLGKFVDGSTIAAAADKQPDLTKQIFGGAALFAGLQTLTGLAKGGVKADGTFTNAAFDLIHDPWVGRFKAASLRPELQIIQVNAAVDRFKSSVDKIKASMPKVTSERGTAFIVDLANQFGDGGAKSIYTAVEAAATGEADLLAKARDESSARLSSIFTAKGKSEATIKKIVAAGVARRQFFIDTPLLSD